MKRLHVHVGVADLEQSIRFYSTLFGAQPTQTGIGLCEVDARRSAREFCDLEPQRRRSGSQSSRHSGRRPGGTRPDRGACEGRRRFGSDRDRRVVLLRAVEQSVGRGPDRDPLGDLLHVRRHHNLRPLGRGKPNRIEVSAGRSCTLAQVAVGHDRFGGERLFTIIPPRGSGGICSSVPIGCIICRRRNSRNSTLRLWASARPETDCQHHGRGLSVARTRRGDSDMAHDARIGSRVFSGPRFSGAQIHERAGGARVLDHRSAPRQTGVAEFRRRRAGSRSRHRRCAEQPRNAVCTRRARS